MLSYLIENDKLIKSQGEKLSIFGNRRFFSVLTPVEFSKMNIEKIHPYSLSDLGGPRIHPRLDVHTDYSYGLLTMTDVDKNDVELFPFSFYLSKNALILIAKDQNRSFENFFTELNAEELSERHEQVTPQTILLALFEKILSENEEYLEKIENDLEALEDRVLESAEKEYLREIVGMRKLVMRFKHEVEPLTFLLQSLCDNQNDLLNRHEVRTFRVLLSKANLMVSNVILMRDYATQIREAFEAERDIKNNDIMRLLTIVTSIFFPLSLIVGWYGMNFHVMPELSWSYGYVYVIILSVAIFVSLLLYFKRKKWM